jgi:multidrug resistance efflux pump
MAEKDRTEPVLVPEEAHERLNDPVELGEAEEASAPAPAAGAPAPAPPARGWAPPKRGWRFTLLLAVFAVAGALLALWAWDLPPFSHAIESTDNAFVRGQTTIISPQVTGYVREVLVQDYQQVAAGQVLVRIDDRSYAQRLEQAQANVATQNAALANWRQSQRSAAAQIAAQDAAVLNAQAQVTRSRTDLARVQDLAVDRSVSLRERDQAVATLRQSEAALSQAQAQHTIAQEQARTVDVNRASLEAAVQSAIAAQELAQIDLSNTVIKAPRAGELGEIGVHVGQFVTAGTQLLFLVPTNVWVVANFKEAQTAHMRPGQLATVRVDALAGETLRGRVSRISPATGSEFAVIRPDNATGNFVKVPQRIGVRIELDPGQPLLDRLRPGLSVIARVDTSSGGKP